MRLSVLFYEYFPHKLLQKQIQKLPDEIYAAKIVRQVFDESISVVDRFPTGLCHFVYDVITETGKEIVVRIARLENRSMLSGAMYWYQLLKPQGVPLPKIIYSAVDEANAFPFMILERFAGEDLGIVYPRLSKGEKKNLAEKTAAIQKIVGALPPAKGFGFVESYSSNFFQEKWIDVLYTSLKRSRQRMQAVGIENSQNIDRVAKKFNKFKDYLSQIEPKPFLDDITTKNVIVHKGELSGIVDVDHVCFGDNLLTIALTQMSLLKTRFDLDYIDFWCETAEVTPEQRGALQLYTALFCLDFMSELGQSFNKENARPVDSEEIQILNEILDSLLRQI